MRTHALLVIAMALLQLVQAGTTYPSGASFIGGPVVVRVSREHPTSLMLGSLWVGGVFFWFFAVYLSFFLAR